MVGVMSSLQPTAADWALRRKIGQQFDDRDIVLVAAYKDFLIGGNDEDEPTPELEEALENVSELKSGSIYGGIIIDRIVDESICDGFSVCAKRFDEEHLVNQSKVWTATRWCDYLSDKIRIGRDSTRADCHNALGIVDFMGDVLRRLQVHPDMPESYRDFNGLEDWIAELRNLERQVFEMEEKMLLKQQDIANYGWSRMSNSWFPHDHLVWVYRYWDEVFEDPIPGRPNYPPI